MTFIINSSYAALSGLIIYIVLIVIQQKWVNTLHYLITYLLLPPITFVITNVISNNLALSLGMLGALSIVRFRNPVKNPFELVIFFALITVGIGFATNFILGLTLTIVVILLIIISKIYEDILKKKGKNLFSLSFEEGSTINVMEIKSSLPIQQLDESKLLAQSFSTKNPISFNYRLICSDKNEINNLKKSIEQNKDIESIEMRYAP